MKLLSILREIRVQPKINKFTPVKGNQYYIQGAKMLYKGGYDTHLYIGTTHIHIFKNLESSQRDIELSDKMLQKWYKEHKVKSILKEIRIIPGSNRYISLKELEWPMEVGKIVELPWSPNKPKRKVLTQYDFNDWFKLVKQIYGENLLFDIKPNPDYKRFYHSKIVVEVAKINTPENEKYWNN